MRAWMWTTTRSGWQMRTTKKKDKKKKRNTQNHKKAEQAEIALVWNAPKGRLAKLKKLKLINKNSRKLKILGTGKVKDKINIEADLASKSAIEKLEKIGGSIQIKK